MQHQKVCVIVACIRQIVGLSCLRRVSRLQSPSSNAWAFLLLRGRFTQTIAISNKAHPRIPKNRSNLMDPTQSTSTTPAPGVELGGQDASAGGGFEICIDVGGDGSIAVKAEPKAEEMAEPHGAMSGKPAKDIGEALAMALEIFKAGGQMPDAQGESAAMSAGFNKVKQVGM